MLGSRFSGWCSRHGMKSNFKERTRQGDREQKFQFVADKIVIYSHPSEQRKVYFECKEGAFTTGSS